MSKTHRNLAIDYHKGIIVALMVFCHVLQYFCNTGEFPEQQWIIMAVCALAFPTFLFAYGRSVYLAYYKKPFREAAPRMVGSIARSYLAFVISGVAHEVLSGGQPFRLPMIQKICMLKTVPGMSEFLAAFAVLGLIALILFPALKWLVERKWLFWPVLVAFFFSVLIPHDEIRHAHLGLLIGTGRYCAFPVAQFFPFFLAGLYVARHGMNKKLLWIGVTAVMTGLAVAYTVKNGEPARFPPELMWLFLPCLPIVLLHLASEGLGRLSAGFGWMRRALSPIESMGRNSLFYLLVSNLVIFAVRCMYDNGSSVLPTFYPRAQFPFTLRLRSTPWALFWSLALLVCIGIVAGMNRKPSKNPKPVKE